MATIKFKRKEESYASIDQAKEAMALLTGIEKGEPITFYYNDGGISKPLFGVGKGDVNGTVDIVGQYVSKLNQNQEMLNSIGGLNIGTKVSDLNKKTLSEILDEILFPKLLPSVTNEGSAKLTISNNSLIKVGTNPSMTLTATLDRGQWTLNGNKQIDYLGEAKTYAFSVVSDSVENTQTLNPSSATANNTCQVTIQNLRHGTTKYNVSIDYAEGGQAKDSMGNDYGSVAPSGSKSANVIGIKGVYPYFATTKTTGVLTEQSLINDTQGTSFEINFIAGTLGNPQTFELPVTMKGVGVTPSFKMEVYEPSSKNWFIINFSSYFNDGIESTKNIFGTNNDISYFKYISKDEEIGSRIFKITL